MDIEERIERECEEEKLALARAAARIIRHWQGIGMSQDTEQRTWRIYLLHSPEMEVLRTALGEDGIKTALEEKNELY